MSTVIPPRGHALLDIFLKYDIMNEIGRCESTLQGTLSSRMDRNGQIRFTVLSGLIFLEVQKWVFTRNYSSAD